MNDSLVKPAVLPHISVVIPVYRTACFIQELYNRLNKVIEPITTNFEIIMVEDCGGDNSWQLITEIAKKDSRVKGIQFSRNFGQHYGITAGLDVASGDWVVVMDGDLQDRPEEILRLYEKAQEGYSVVLARRLERNYPFFHNITSKLFYKTFNFLTDSNFDQRCGNYRIISRDVALYYRGMRERLRSFGGLVDWLGFPVSYVDVNHDNRLNGKSSYSLKKRWRLAYEIIIAYSDKPLKLSIQIGFLMALLAFLYGLYVIYQALFMQVSIIGWSSLMVSVYFIGGLIISLLGIIGIYIGKAFDEVKGRPLYVINKKVNL